MKGKTPQVQASLPSLLQIAPQNYVSNEEKTLKQLSKAIKSQQSSPTKFQRSITAEHKSVYSSRNLPPSMLSPSVTASYKSLHHPPTANSSRSYKKEKPKLYTNILFERYSNKLDQTKARYANLYKSISRDVAIEDIAAQRIQDLVSNSEEILSSTYSVKYFGVNNDQIGILSKRVPMPSSLRPNTVSFQNNLGTTASHFNQHLAKTSTGGFYAETKHFIDANAERYGEEIQIQDPNSGHATGEITVEGTQPHQTHQTHEGGKQLLLNTANSSTNNLRALKPLLHHQRPSESSGSEVAAMVYSSSQKRLSFENQPSNEQIEEVPEEQFGSKDLRSETPMTMPPSDQQFIIHQYSLPKALRAANRDKSNPRHNRAVTSEFFKDNKDQRLINTLHFEKHLDNFYKNKKRLQMFAGSAKSKKVEEPKDLSYITNIPDKFRTHEMNKLLDLNPKFSYSKLIQAVGSIESPRTRAARNAKALHQMLAVNDSPIKASSLSTRGTIGQRSLTANKGYQSVEISLNPPKDNVLYSRYNRIKGLNNHEGKSL